MSVIKCEMAGTVIEIKVKVGDSVSVGSEVAVVESMKMEVPVMSSIKGTVIKILKKNGEFVNDGEPLIELQ